MVWILLYGHIDQEKQKLHSRCEQKSIDRGLSLGMDKYETSTKPAWYMNIRTKIR